MAGDRHSRTVLVAGASGFVGGAVVERLAADPDTRVIGVSRRRPATLPEDVRHIPLDLLDAEACRNAGSALAEVTHFVYAAVNETPGDLVASWTDPTHAARNGRMFEALVDPLLEAAGGLRQVVLMHGTKAYASHLGDRPVAPMRESLPRPPHDDFYFRQEDHLWDRRRGADWRWTVFRAPMIAGGGRGSNLNALLAICVFASLRRAAGLSLPFPGALSNLGVMEMVDVDLLARAVDWALEAPEADDQIFNVANGDVYVWPDLWPAIAGEIGVPVGEPEPMSVAAAIDGHAALWGEIVRRHRLSAPEQPRALLGESGALADFALGNCGHTVVTSTVKLRRAGFCEVVDTTESVLGWIRRWRAEGLLPPA
jgi:nucleoside-diphosphate-sugar epimerase